MFPARFLALTLAVFIASEARAATFEELASRAAAARDANNLTEAIQLYREALKLNSRWQEGWWFLGTIAYDTNDYRSCRDALRQLIALKPDATPAFAILGLCEFQTGDFVASLAHVQRGLASAPDAQPEMEKVLRYHEAMLFTRAGEFDKALQKYAWFVRWPDPSAAFLASLGLAALRTPYLPKDTPADQQELFIAAGQAAFSQMSGDRSTARHNFETLLERYPQAHHVHYLYACSLLASNPEGAIGEFRRELEITPSSGGTLGMLAWALLNRGEPAAALPYAERAVKAAPSDSLSQYVLGRALVETGDALRGVRHLETALRSDPTNLEHHLALAAAYPKVHRYEDARRERQKSLELAGGGSSVAQP